MTRHAIAALVAALTITAAACGDPGPTEAVRCAAAGGVWVVTDYYQPQPVNVGGIAVPMPATIEHACIVGGQVLSP